MGSCYDPAKLLFYAHLRFHLLQVLSIITFKFVPEPVLIKVANHTECKCMEPAIIRRNAQLHRSNGSVQPLQFSEIWVLIFQFKKKIFSCSCSEMLQLSKDSRRLCANGLIWDCSTDRCVPYPSSASGVRKRVCKHR